MFWSDSSVVIQSLHNDRKRFPMFVARRIALIVKHTCASNWSHVPTKLNPADFASRGAIAEKLLQNKIWFSGPEFLQNKPDVWPCRFKKVVMSPEDIKAFDKSPAEVFFISTVNSAVDRLISYFSCFYKLKRATAWLLRFKQYLKFRANKSDSDLIKCSLSVSELKYAESELMKHEQRQHFARWLMGTAESKQSSQKSSSLQKLNPIVVDGLLRVGGRLEKAPISMKPVTLSLCHTCPILLI